MSNFWDLINVEELWDKRENFNKERWSVSFFCKDCEAIVETERKNPRWYIFICKKCKGKNIAIWTEEGLKSNYRKRIKN